MVQNETDDIGAWSKQLRKGVLDLAILGELAAGPAHGYAIISRLKAADIMPADGAEATVYQALQRLAKAGWAEAAWSAPKADERPRKMYALTRSGRTARAAMEEEWGRLREAVRPFMEENA